MEAKCVVVNLHKKIKEKAQAELSKENQRLLIQNQMLKKKKNE